MKVKKKDTKRLVTNRSNLINKADCLKIKKIKKEDHIRKGSGLGLGSVSGLGSGLGLGLRLRVRVVNVLPVPV